MRKSKSVMSLLLAAGLCISLTACGGSASAPETTKSSTKAAEEKTQQAETAKAEALPNEGETITLWLPPYSTEDIADRDFWMEALQPVMDETGCKIEFEVTPWDNYVQQYLTAVTAGKGPDIGYMYIDMIGDFIDMNALADLDDYLTEEDRSQYLYLDKGFVKGGQYMLPFVVGNARVLFCNMDILNQAGITETPKTWDEFIQTAQAVKEKVPDVDPFLCNWGDTSGGVVAATYFPYLWQAGGDIFDGNSKLTLNTPEALEAAQFIYDMKFKYEILPEKCTSMTNNDCVDEFKAGKCAMFVTGDRNSTKWDAAGINWDFTSSLKGKQNGTFIAADSLVMLNSCENKELAMKVMRRLTSPEVMEKFHKDLYSAPPLSSGEAYLSDAKFKPMYENEKDTLHILPAVSGSAQIYDVLYKNLQSMLLGDYEPQQVLDEITAYSETVLK